VCFTFLSMATHVLLQRRRLAKVLLAHFTLKWPMSGMTLWPTDVPLAIASTVRDEQ
jgi:hypothetical protein